MCHPKEHNEPAAFVEPLLRIYSRYSCSKYAPGNIEIRLWCRSNFGGVLLNQCSGIFPRISQRVSLTASSFRRRISP